jgi:hypothetical protein
MDDLKLAQELYEDAISATRDQRKQIEEDLEFSDPSPTRSNGTRTPSASARWTRAARVRVW